MTAAPACVCGHAKVAHEHYRDGSDCAVCACKRYRRPSRVLDVIKAKLGRGEARLWFQSVMSDHQTEHLTV